MSVDLTGIPISRATPRLMEYGGLLVPSLGGTIQKLNRLGTRWAWMFETTAMPVEPAGRRWAAALARAKREGAIMRLSQPGLTFPNAGASPSVRITTGAGRTIPAMGLGPNYAYAVGQWLSVVHGGRRYIDQITADGAASGSGVADLPVQLLLRTPLSAGDLVEIKEPKIEGWIDGDFEWPVERNRTTSFTFTIMEAR